MRARAGAAVGLALCIAACGDEPAPVPSAGGAGADFVTLHEVAERSGIRFTHRNGATPRKYMLESMGGGVCVVDYDGDGRDDLYFVDSGAVPPDSATQLPGGSRLYRNLGGWRFEDVTERAGVRGRGYMMGAIAGDYDADGDQDLYVTSYGSNVLYRNAGDGTFRDVTREAGCDDARWSTSAAFFDCDGDGDLDLFVESYVAWTIETHRPYFQGELPIMPTPQLLDPTANTLFENLGDGTFRDRSAESGIAAGLGKSLGVLAADLDADGDTDLYCASDMTQNLLFENLGHCRFREIGAYSGAGYSEEGLPQSGMGVDGADLNGDGVLDIVVTNFAGEPYAIYRGEGRLFYTEVSAQSGTLRRTVPDLGFGVRLLDLDNDGVEDIVFANGHIDDNIELHTVPNRYRQEPHLFRGLGGARFEDVAASQPLAFREPRVARGLAASDFDDDGDLDLVFGILGGRACVYENRGGERRSWISVRCLGTRSATPFGTRVTVEAGGRTQFHELSSGGSYLSQSTLRLHFGLGDAPKVERVTVRWLDGTVEEARDVPARQHLVFRQGSGLVR